MPLDLSPGDPFRSNDIGPRPLSPPNPLSTLSPSLKLSHPLLLSVRAALLHPGGGRLAAADVRGESEVEVSKSGLSGEEERRIEGMLTRLEGKSMHSRPPSLALHRPSSVFLKTTYDSSQTNPPSVIGKLDILHLKR